MKQHLKFLKLGIEMRIVINRARGNKALNEVKLVENINKNYLNFQEVHHMQKEVFPLCELLDHVYQ